VFTFTEEARMTVSRSVVARGVLASLASATFASALYHLIAGEHGGRLLERAFLDSVIVVPAVAAGLIWLRPIAAQLLARGAWWSFLLGGGLLSVAARDDVARFGFLAVACNGIALLAAGRTGLGEGAEGAGRFRPVAFRGTLILALVLAIADTGAFLWMGSGTAMFGGHPSLLIMAMPMAVGVLGLLRLRTWGLLLSLASSLLVAILGSTGVLYLEGPLRTLFVSTACLQLLVPLPMLVSIWRGRSPGPDRWQRAKARATTTVIAGIAGVSLYAAFVHGPLFRF
jgi:hypothetical protein